MVVKRRTKSRRSNAAVWGALGARVKAEVGGSLSAASFLGAPGAPREGTGEAALPVPVEVEAVRGGASRAPFAFSLEKVRFGLPLTRDVDVTEATRRLYREVPESTLGVLEALYVSGRASDFRQMRQMVRSRHRVDVEEDVIRYHLALNFDRLNKERQAFLEEQKTALVENFMRRETNPEVEQYQRITDNLAMILGGITDEIVDGRQPVDPRGLKTLVETLKLTLETDPAMRKVDIKNRVQAEVAGAMIRDSATAKAGLRHMRAYKARAKNVEKEKEPFREAEAEDSDEFQDMTDRIIERVVVEDADGG